MINMLKKIWDKHLEKNILKEFKKDEKYFNPEIYKKLYKEDGGEE